MIDISCVILGKEFSPKKLKKQNLGIELTNENEPGDIGKIGRYKNSPIPYGACTLRPICNDDECSVIEWMADFIHHNMSLLLELDVEDFSLSILWTGIQGNMEFSPIELEKLARLKLSLSITYSFEE